MPATIVFAKAYRDRKPAPKPAGTSVFDLDDLNKLPKSEAWLPRGDTKRTAPRPLRHLPHRRRATPASPPLRRLRSPPLHEPPPASSRRLPRGRRLFVCVTSDASRPRAGPRRCDGLRRTRRRPPRLVHGQTFPSYSRTHIRKSINVQGVHINGKRQGRNAQVRAPVTSSPSRSPNSPAKARCRRPFRWRFSTKTTRSPSSTSRPAWSCIPAEGIGKARSLGPGCRSTNSASSAAPRTGIVHRLDRDTGGEPFSSAPKRPHHRGRRPIRKSHRDEIFAITAGVPDHNRDLIDLPIGPHPYQREKMAIRRDHPGAHRAKLLRSRTTVRGLRGSASILPKTGRTHRIRLHLASIGCPVLCDRLYGGRTVSRSANWRSRQALRGSARCPQTTTPRPPTTTCSSTAKRCMRFRLTIRHPLDDRELTFEAPLPPDMRRTLNALAQFRALR